MIRTARPEDIPHLLRVAGYIAKAAYPHLTFVRERAYKLIRNAVSSADCPVLIREIGGVPCGTIGGFTLEYDAFEKAYVLIKLLQSDSPYGLVMLLDAVREWAEGRRKVNRVALIRDYLITDRQTTVMHWALTRAGYILVGGTYQARTDGISKQGVEKVQARG